MICGQFFTSVALPLAGFTKGGDAASFRRRRYVELKHGRVAMLACMGYIVPEYYRWPGELSPSLGLKFTDVPTGFAAFSKVPQWLGSDGGFRWQRGALPVCR